MTGVVRRAEAIVRPPLSLEGWAILAFLILPCLVFPAFLGVSLPTFGIALAGVVAIPFFRTVSNPAFCAGRSPDRVVIVAFAIAAVLLVTFGGASRLAPVTSDWLIRDAVLHDLVAQAWPFSYGFDDEVWTLRAPLGMYLLPALAGKILGMRWAWTTLAIQNSLIVFVIFRILFASGLARDSLILMIVFCMFSGWDVGGKMLTAPPGSHAPVLQLITGGDLEWWIRIFQYSSNFTLFVWVQNHAIAGWIVTALLLLRDRGQIGFAALAMGTAMAVIWSPFALIGAFPFVAKNGVEAVLRREVKPRDVAACLLLAIALLPLALYQTADAAEMPSRFMPLSLDSFVVQLVFVAIEVMPFVLVNFAFGAERGGFSRSSYLIAVAILLLLPMYRLGSANDLVMRASIPALAILAVTTGHTALRVLRDRNVAGIAVVGLTLLIGAITPLNQVFLMLRSPYTGISKCDLIQAWDQHPTSSTPKSHYFARTADLPALIRPDHPHIYATQPTTASCMHEKL